jgi:hypothetical protein
VAGQGHHLGNAVAHGARAEDGDVGHGGITPGWGWGPGLGA